MKLTLGRIVHWRLKPADPWLAAIVSEELDLGATGLTVFLLSGKTDWAVVADDGEGEVWRWPPRDDAPAPAGEPEATPEPIDTGNYFMVGGSSAGVQIMSLPTGPLSVSLALNLAAYLVALSGVERFQFLAVLDAIESA